MKQMIKRKDGSYSQRGLWDNIRAKKGSGKKPTPEMLKQEKKIKAESKMKLGGRLKAAYLKSGGTIRHTTKGPEANYRPTKSGAGMTKKGVEAYRRANPGSKLKTAVTGKVKPGSKSAMRRKSYCARSLGQLKDSSAETRNDPNSRIRQARRRWKC
jgi:hypothetical protein